MKKRMPSSKIYRKRSVDGTSKTEIEKIIANQKLPTEKIKKIQKALKEWKILHK